MAVKELIHALVDTGSFVETDAGCLCGVTTGIAMMHQLPVSLLCVEKAVLGVKAMRKTQRLLEKTLLAGMPLIMSFEDAEGLDETQEGWEVLKQIVRLSGACPMLALICGAQGAFCRMLAPYADFRIYANAAQANATCLDLPRADLPAAIETLRSLLYLLPSNCAENALLLDVGDELNRTDEEKSNPSAPELVNCLSDRGSLQLLYQDQHILTGLTRIGGRSCGVVIADEGSVSAACVRFIRFCDCYSLPLLWIGGNSFAFDEKLVFAMSEATTLKLGIALRGAELPKSFFDMVLTLTGDESAATADDQASCGEIRILTINALELLSAKRDVLPPHKHGNMPL